MRSIDLAWLSRRDKQLALPDLKFHDLGDVAGCYCQPEWRGHVYRGLEIESGTGTIVVNPQIDQFAATLAHEWRHHWQYWRGLLINTREWKDTKAGWLADIRAFFQIPYERDALQFEVMVAPTECGKEWLSLVNSPK